MKKIFLLLVIMTISLGIWYFYQNNDKENTIIFNEENDSLPMALMVETEIDSEEYKPWESEEWPGVGYVFNDEKSGCENGGTLEYNPETQSVIMKTNISDKCYAYFDNYTINSIDDLVDFSQKVNAGKTYENITIVLAKDLDFQDPNSYEDKKVNNDLATGVGFTPIGNSTNSFQGTFEGNNKTISNLTINDKTSSNSYVGLFGHVKNSNINNLTVTGSIELALANTVGLIAYAEGGNFNNITNQMNITQNTGMKDTGGIIGTGDGTLNIKNCSNYGLITNGSSVGGIIGSYSGNALLIENCINNNTISNNKGTILSGIIGSITNSTNIVNSINNCHNKGNLYSNKDVEETIIMGGIAGLTYSTSINNCSNTEDFINDRKEYVGFTGIHIGGIVGTTNGTSKISNSFNTGNFSNSNRIGGIISSNTSAILIVDQCYNTGNLISDLVITTTGSVAGGLIGDSGVSANTYILNSYNIGNINSEIDSSSGIMDSSIDQKLILINSYNAGTIGDKYSDNSYGITKSYANNTIIKNVFNVGTLESTTSKMGIAYISSSNYNIKNAYYINATGATGTNLSNDSELTTSLSEDIMKNQSVISNSKYFVDILNENLNDINLSAIDPLLEGYTLHQWVKGKDGYPIFDYQQ